MSDKRFTIKPQDDYWAVVDNYNEDKVCIINGIHTEIEAIWLCDFMNEQQSTIKHLEEEMGELENDLLTARREKMDNYYPIPKNCDTCVFLKNNGICGYCTFTLKCYDSEDDLDEYGTLPSCPFKHHQEYRTMVMNWDSLVEKTSEISVRNIELVEKNARLQKKIDWLCEVFDYGSDESMQKVKEYEKSKTK